MTKTFARWMLAALLAVAGIAHLLQPRGFRIVVPDWATRISHLDKDAIVIASGAVEIALAAGIVVLPHQRRWVGWSTAAFFVAVLPGNVHQWRTGRSAPGLDTDARRLARLFLQPVLVMWALWSTNERAPLQSRRRD